MYFIEWKGYLNQCLFAFSGGNFLVQCVRINYVTSVPGCYLRLKISCKMYSVWLTRVYIGGVVKQRVACYVLYLLDGIRVKQENLETINIHIYRVACQDREVLVSQAASCFGQPISLRLPTSLSHFLGGCGFSTFFLSIYVFVTCK